MAAVKPRKKTTIRKTKQSTKKTKQERLLEQTYYTAQRPGAFAGVEAVRRATHLKKSTIKDWLSFQDAYTLHKPVRYNFPRRRVIVGGIDDQWQSDLMAVPNLKKHNDGYTFLLLVIDVLSKYVWVVPLKNKTGSSLVQAFQIIFSQGRKPSKLQTDKGSEFRNKIFQKFLKEEGVHFFTSENEETKASIAERAIRTIKQKLWHYFTKQNTLRFVEVLPKLVKSYNHSFHRSIKKAPVEVDKANEEEVWQTLYNNTTNNNNNPNTRKREVMKPGDRVRISKTRRVFKKGYLPSWTEELFTINCVLKTIPITYTLKDDHGDELRGSFYSQELQKVGAKDIFRIESILQQRVNSKGKEEYLVKWFGYDSSFNSWIPKSSLARYPH
jgi:hypothetical protein